MDSKFDSIFNAIGWNTFWDVSHDLGSKTLTLEFLSTLQASNDGVYFSMFNHDYNFTWESFSVALGFAHTCDVDLENATCDFNKLEFWYDITRRDECDKPRTNHIHNPTLRFMHHWIGITLFPHNDVRIVKSNDLRIMYTMVHKIHVSPVKGSIEFTSLISRIVDVIGVLTNNSIQFITTPRSLITIEYF